jgi:DNA-binding MarR family transcriptional regulator
VLLIIKVNTVARNPRATLAVDPPAPVKSADTPTALGQSTGFLLGRAAAIARADFRSRLEAHGLNAKHYTVLTHVAEHGARSQSAIGAVLGLDRTTMVQLIDALEQRGAVQRGLDARNRRAWLILITPAGRQLLRRLARAAGASDHAIQAALSEAEVVQLQGLLARIIEGGPAPSVAQRIGQPLTITNPPTAA